MTAPGFHAPPFVELRQYATQPGQREALIELFEREFVETQEAVGMAVLGQFRDLDEPDRYVWLRGFADLGTRLAGLTAFYGGSIWQAHRSAANATIVDSDNVLLLREARPGRGLELASVTRPALGAAPATAEPRPIFVTTYSLAAPADDALIASVCDGPPALRAVYVTEAATNDYPRLPVREGEQVLVTVATGEPVPAPALLSRAAQAIEVRRLAATPRSLLR